MLIEINLWVNPDSINGQINIDRGSKKFKFSRFVSFNKFIEDGIKRNYASLEEFQELSETLNLDKEAGYAWLGKNGEFVYWNKLNKHSVIFINGKMWEIPINKQYKTGMYRSQPDICFRNE